LKKRLFYSFFKKYQNRSFLTLSHILYLVRLTRGEKGEGKKRGGTIGGRKDRVRIKGE